MSWTEFSLYKPLLDKIFSVQNFLGMLTNISMTYTENEVYTLINQQLLKWLLQATEEK